MANFQTILVSSIIINREDRQRRELNGIDELAESISRVGLIHPIVIDKDNVLVAGERRLTAVKSLGHSHISVQYREDLDPLLAHEIELEENIRRLDITWQEEVDAIKKYHELRKSSEPDWTQEDTANALCMSRITVTDKLRVANEIAAGNERVANADKFSTAKNITERVNSRKQATSRNEADAKIESLFTQVEQTNPLAAKPVPLLNEDFHEWASAYCGPRFNMIHCDFPYGVGMHKSDQGAGNEFGTYADSEDVYWKLLDTFEMAMSNVVDDSAHLIFWFSMDFYNRTLVRLTQMGWKVNPFPLIWFKNDNTGIIPDAQRGPRRVYETAFFASRGDRLLTERGARSNVAAYAGRGKSIHMNEKPVKMLEHFMSMTVDAHSRVLDPTAGSANALKAATNLGAPTVLGLEKDPEFFLRSTEAYYLDDDEE